MSYILDLIFFTISMINRLYRALISSNFMKVRRTNYSDSWCIIYDEYFYNNLFVSCEPYILFCVNLSMIYSLIDSL